MAIQQNLALKNQYFSFVQVSLIFVQSIQERYSRLSFAFASQVSLRALI